MSAATHLYRRKAVYYWRRRLPPALSSWFHKRHLFMSLQTPEPTFARRLVVLLDAKLEEVVTAFENADMHLTPPQLDGVLRDVVTKHLNKLERLSASAKSFPGFDASQAERSDGGNQQIAALAKRGDAIVRQSAMSGSFHNQFHVWKRVAPGERSRIPGQVAPTASARWHRCR